MLHNMSFPHYSSDHRHELLFELRVAMLSGGRDWAHTAGMKLRRIATRSISHKEAIARAPRQADYQRISERRYVSAWHQYSRHHDRSRDHSKPVHTSHVLQASGCDDENDAVPEPVVNVLLLSKTSFHSAISAQSLWRTGPTSLLLAC